MAQGNMNGSMKRNPDKTDANPTWADYKGSATINGTKYWISGWIKDGEDGKWMSLSFKAAGEATQTAPKPETREKPGSDFNDDIPF